MIPDKEWDLLGAHFGSEKESLKGLISGDESVVYSCSPMQWILHSIAIPAIIIIMWCYKTVVYIDIYPRISLVSVLKNG